MAINSLSVATAFAGGALRQRLRRSVPTRGGHDGPSRWTTPGHQEKPNGYFLNRTPPPPGDSRKWEDWELPCYITSFLTVVILGVGLNAKPDLTLETWAREKALERLKAQAQQQQEETAQRRGDLLGLVTMLLRSSPCSQMINTFLFCFRALYTLCVGDISSFSSHMAASDSHLPISECIVNGLYDVVPILNSWVPTMGKEFPLTHLSSAPPLPRGVAFSGTMIDNEEQSWLGGQRCSCGDGEVVQCSISFRLVVISPLVETCYN